MFIRRINWVHRKWKRDNNIIRIWKFWFVVFIATLNSLIRFYLHANLPWPRAFQTRTWRSRNWWKLRAIYVLASSASFLYRKRQTRSLNFQAWLGNHVYIYFTLNKFSIPIWIALKEKKRGEKNEEKFFYSPSPSPTLSHSVSIYKL